jgi:hypothetical protein
LANCGFESEELRKPAKHIASPLPVIEMKKTLYILFSLLVFNINYTNACDCYYFGGFAHSNQLSDLVVHGKVIEYDCIGTHSAPENPYSMKFEIIEKYRGIESRDTIIIWGDYGADCRPYISHFKPNTEWVLALDNYKSKSGNDYEISDCGEFFVPVENNKAFGRIFGRDLSIQEKHYELSIIREMVNSFEKYNLYTKRKAIKADKDGNTYLSNCDQPPRNRISLDEINKLMNCEIILPQGFMKTGDNYLIHATGIVTDIGEFKFLGIYQNKYRPSEHLANIERQVSSILRELEDWEIGLNADKPVSAFISIPILLSK